jgi:hypothetical protein
MGDNIFGGTDRGSYNEVKDEENDADTGRTQISILK